MMEHWRLLFINDDELPAFRIILHDDLATENIKASQKRLFAAEVLACTQK